MQVFNKIKNYLTAKRELWFWRNPEVYLAAILFEGGDQVYGEVKGDFALLDGIPKPETGYFYKDVVRVIGPTGTQTFRDEIISEYMVVKVHKKSNCPTFSFSAILPHSKDYFYLQYEFTVKGEKLRVRFPWSSVGSATEWKHGFCTAESLDRATQLLNQFVSKGEGRNVKDIKFCGA